LHWQYPFDIAFCSEPSQLLASGEIMGIYGLSKLGEKPLDITNWRSSASVSVKLCYIFCSEAWKGKTVRSLLSLFNGAKIFSARSSLALFLRKPKPTAATFFDRSVFRIHPARKYYSALPQPEVKSFCDLNNIFTRPTGGIRNRR
jgi:hypothetical protein